MRRQFLVEIGDGSSIADLAELNRLFTAWCETVYHARPHGETGQPPMDRWLAGAPFPVPEPAQLREAFLWSEIRLVRRDATIRLFGGAYETDPALAGRKVECVFDPFDLTVLEIRWNGSPYGLAAPGRSPGTPIPGPNPRNRYPPPATGIDYLGIIAAEHAKPPACIASATTPSLTATASPGRSRRSERAAAACLPAAQVSAVLAWAARLPAAARAPSRSPPTSPPRPPSWNASPPSASKAAGPRRHHRRRRGRRPCPRNSGRRRAARRRRHHHHGGRHDRPEEPLRVHPHPVRQGPRPVHAPPLPRPRRGRRPHHLVRPRARPRGHYGRSRRRKTASARAAIAALDQTRHTLIYLPDPTTGTRGIHHDVVTALGSRPAHGSAELAAQAASLIAAERGERGRVPLL